MNADAATPTVPPLLGPDCDVAFTARVDHTTQYYIEKLPPAFNKAAPHDALIALHGHGSDRKQYASDPRDECRAARDIAAGHDMIFISPDYRAKTSWMGPAAEADLLQIIAELRAKRRVSRIFLTGGSMGGSSALTFTALHPDLIAGVAAANPLANHLEYTNFQDAISASFGGSKATIPFEYKKRSAEYWPEQFTMPTAITTGGQDTSVPPQSALRLAGILKTLGRPILLIHREATGHLTNYADMRAALEFVIDRAKRPHDQ